MRDDAMTRISEATRESALSDLSRHYANGTIDLADLEARAALALTAADSDALAGALDGLPPLTAELDAVGAPIRLNPVRRVPAAPSRSIRRRVAIAAALAVASVGALAWYGPALVGAPDPCFVGDMSQGVPHPCR
jgi:hypothetical protein